MSKQPSTFILCHVPDGTPEIQPVPGGGILSEGETLSLTCRGGFFTSWDYPESVESRVHLSFKTEMLGDSILAWRYTSTLTVENVVYTDTGEYQCAHHHSSPDDMLDEGETEDKVYIYVTKSKGMSNYFM